MIEQRKLNSLELLQLLNEAPEHETKHLKEYLMETKQDAYSFFENNAVDYFGLVADGRPIYVAVLMKEDGDFQFWTVVNSKVKQIISLCKYAKRELNRWLEKYSPIYAMMESNLKENIKWTRWLGFDVHSQNNGFITLKITKER